MPTGRRKRKTDRRKYKEKLSMPQTKEEVKRKSKRKPTGKPLVSHYTLPGQKRKRLDRRLYALRPPSKTKGRRPLKGKVRLMKTPAGKIKTRGRERRSGSKDRRKGTDRRSGSERRQT